MIYKHAHRHYILYQLAFLYLSLLLMEFWIEHSDSRWTEVVNAARPARDIEN